MKKNRQKLQQKINSGTWQKGCPSPNPSGRPKGSRNKMTEAAQALLEEKSERIMRTAVDMAIDGETPILKHMLDRILPAMRSAPVNLALPTTNSSQDRFSAAQSVMEAVSAGELTPKEALHMMQLLDKLSASTAA